jgi:hypothetical protein
MKPTKYYLQKGQKREERELREYSRGGELIHSALYASMEISK